MRRLAFSVSRKLCLCLPPFAHPQPVKNQGQFHLSGTPRNSDCSLDIRDVQRIDSGSYFFRIEKDSFKWNDYKNQLSVQVTALTHTPNIDIPQMLELGLPSNVTCSVPWACERGTPPIFSWMTTVLASLGPRTTLSSVLTLTPRFQDHGTNLICQVAFPGVSVTVQKTVQINVSWISGPLAEVVLVAIGEVTIKFLSTTKFLRLGICFFFLRKSRSSTFVRSMRLDGWMSQMIFSIH
uniref:myeloid cell surface antigen CD33-like n=1 Tax=Myodes glareolus TaxID=447135 RepID=UPI0020208EFF|nr:myeloid cell surface antigen CD33-like [Myodes glareolus]